MIESLWQWMLLLIPVAFLMGWLIARRRNKKARRQLRFSNDYFQGLNYLLNDEQDKALNVFLRLVEIDWETIDTSLALGAIFRRKGEIDKSIKLHQNLLARPSLPVEYKYRVLLELGRDYQLAGWLDRAEGLFNEVLKDDVYEHEALEHLMSIYQQEQEWQSAINVARRYQKNGKKDVRPVIAQFYCELSDMTKEQGDLKEAEALSTQALSSDENCVRASVQLGDIAIRNAQYKKAIRFLQQVEHQDPTFMPMVVDQLAVCYKAQSNLKTLISYLKDFERSHQNINLAPFIAELIKEEYDKEDAIAFLRNDMLNHPSLLSMKKMMEYKTPKLDCPEGYLPEVIDQLALKQSGYQCSKCGYAGNTLYWLCPTCHTWGGMKPK